MLDVGIGDLFGPVKRNTSGSSDGDLFASLPSKLTHYALSAFGNWLTYSVETH